MMSKWLDALKEEENEHNTAAALPAREEEKREKVRVFLESVRIATAKTAKMPPEGSVFSENPKNLTAKTAKTLTEAEQLGLVATWSVEFGFVSLHDPTTGEWYDLPTKEAPDWAVGEARKRKELYRDGNRKAFRLTSLEMEEIWEAERPVEKEGIVEEHPVEEKV